MTPDEIALLVSGIALGAQAMLITQAIQNCLDDRRERRVLDEARARIARTEATEAMREGVDRFRATLHDGGHLPKEEA